MNVQRRSPVEPDVMHALKAVGGLWPAQTRGLPYARLVLDVLGLIGGLVGSVALAAALPGIQGDRTSAALVLGFTVVVSVLGALDVLTVVRASRPAPAPVGPPRLRVVR